MPRACGASPGARCLRPPGRRTATIPRPSCASSRALCQRRRQTPLGSHPEPALRVQQHEISLSRRSRGGLPDSRAGRPAPRPPSRARPRVGIATTAATCRALGNDAREPDCDKVFLRDGLDAQPRQTAHRRSGVVPLRPAPSLTWPSSRARRVVGGLPAFRDRSRARRRVPP